MHAHSEGKKEEKQETIKSFIQERDELDKLQKELKSQPSEFYESLDPAIVDPLKDFGQGKEKTLQRIFDDAKVLHESLTCDAKISKEKQTTTTKPYSLEEFLTNPPDCILIPGHNDLNVIDFVVSLYRKLLEKFSIEKLPTFFVSGFGGHGTTHGYIFALSEAKTMVDRLIQLGIPKDKIVVEHDATDTGKNMRYMGSLLIAHCLLNPNDKLKEKLDTLNLQLDDKQKSFLNELINLQRNSQCSLSANDAEKLEMIIKPMREKLIANKICLFENIFVPTSPFLQFRQLLTVEQQLFKKSPFAKEPSPLWEAISCISPTLEEIKKNYYSDVKKAAINLIYGLREEATLRFYKSTTDYLPARDWLSQEAKQKNPEANKKPSLAQEKLFEYYEFFSGKKSSDIKLNAKFFRSLWDVTEKLHIKKLNPPMSSKSQTQKLDAFGTFARLNLMPEVTGKVSHKTMRK